MSRNTDYQFVSTDTAALEKSMTEMYTKLTGESVLPASPEKLFIQWVVSVIVQAYVTMNYIGNQNIPSRAIGENLDALGELFYGAERPQAKAAVCVERFSISEAQNIDITIPAGTRVTDASRTLIWETSAEATVPAGSISADVPMHCQSVGTVGNGFLPGQLNTIVDVFAYYTACTNINTTDGGADRATDDEYFALLKASQDAYSTAGPIGAYAYQAKSVSTEIADVKVVRPNRTITKTLTVYDGHAFLGGDNLQEDTLVVTGGTKGTDYTATYADGLIDIAVASGGALSSSATLPVAIKSIDAGCVDIYALMEDGTPASSTIKALILAACNDSTVRPLTDKVSVKDPSSVIYDIDMTYYTSEDGTSSSAEVAAAVSDAVSEYKSWQSAKIGRDINPSKLIACLMATGVLKRVVVTSPTFTSLNDGSDHTTPQLATLGTITITNGGVEDE